MTSMLSRPPPPDPVMILSGATPVTALTFNNNDAQDEQTLFSGHQDGKIIQWCIVTRRPFTVWNGHSDSVLWLAVTKQHLFSSGRDGKVKLWLKSTKQWNLVGEIESATMIFCNCALLDLDASILLAVPNDETSKIDIHHVSEASLSTSLSSQNSFSHSLKPLSSQIYGMCMRMQAVVSDKSSKLIVAYEGGVIAVWDIKTSKILSEMKIHDDCVLSFDIWKSHDKPGVIKGISGSVNNELHTWHIENDQLCKENVLSITNPGFNCVTIRKDGKIFATGGWDHMGRVFSLRKLRPLAVLSYHRESVQCVVFSPDNLLVTGSKDGYIALWDVYKDK